MQKRNALQHRNLPKLGTAALPDIIFMLLFFFMVTTVLRKDQLLVKVQLPKVSELEKLQHRSLVHHLYVGQPLAPATTESMVIQLNDAFIKVENLERAIKKIKAEHKEHLQDRLITSLKVDEAVPMGIVGEVKTELRKAAQLRINYAALPKE